MIFASNAPFIAHHSIFESSYYGIPAFQAIPLVFYVMAMFAYRYIIKMYNIKMAKKIGTLVYTVFGVYMMFIITFEDALTAKHLLALMCVQCVGSAFLVPVSILKALQSSAHASVGASTVVVFRNIVMSLCISLSTRMHSSITMVMGSVFMTVGTVLVLMFTRKYMKKRWLRKMSKPDWR
ncbi:hypothetical protein FACS1894122_05530 [Alphaproteobacteria bacterium]|nr:hypothetical protein FACS1894122_05530 [Alphaproteobacteria bacterium]